MTPTEFRDRLADLGLTLDGFAQHITRTGGEALSPATVHNWAQGRRAIPPTVPAILALLEMVRAFR